MSGPSNYKAPVAPSAYQAPVSLEERARRDQSHYENFRKHNKDRTDVSFFLCHFTKGKHPLNIHTQTAHPGIRGFAHERFEAILTGKEVHDCALPHLGTPVGAACLTEMMQPSLSMHAENYSPWGIAFRKSFLFNNKMANPVLYCRPELFESLKARAGSDHGLLRYMTRFNPKYCEQLVPQGTIDYSHEREWRTPGPVSFELENLACVFVPSIHLFKELMPDLHADLCNKCVEIKVIEKVARKDSCQNGYRCTYRLQCKYERTQDEKDVFQAFTAPRRRPAAEQPGPRAPGEPGLSDDGRIRETAPCRADEDDDWRRGRWLTAPGTRSSEG
mmetsp:Transcript_54352/g.117645  ORF Transcript_54352/g.117645 Transcript_54352/m.117645 type:complete len:331 (+) Transcript_54352:61-1053(+)|eukprot:CAMPEP_0170583852 /NCGR_PEP_ID=MMETSP0224-20130122/8367_1 /TAXON_ID=285029 /ORGANISM="Togula jolla, Strain CCCM 725" /LENGTH=330 /DNA_ID=CAMNT_0010907229 /DNA_START=58 /DNA_END=1050 /DNA_ORIENTATION=-